MVVPVHSGEDQKWRWKPPASVQILATITEASVALEERHEGVVPTSRRKQSYLWNSPFHLHLADYPQLAVEMVPRTSGRAEGIWISYAAYVSPNCHHGAGTWILGFRDLSFFDKYVSAWIKHVP